MLELAEKPLNYDFPKPIRLLAMAIFLSVTPCLVYAINVIDRYPFPYVMFHSTIIGLTTYAGIIGFNLDRTLIFEEYNLSALFVSFCFTAPLSTTVFIFPDIFTRIGCEYNGEWNFIERFMGKIFWGGMTYWLLLPIQFLISLYGRAKILFIIGRVVFWISCFNFILYTAFLSHLISIISWIIIDKICVN